jgi:anti-sigma regulatory factor (Ser/Thr protein kinase)
VTFRLRAAKTEISRIRTLITRTLAGLVDDDHLEDLKVCASELVTNALRAALDYAVLCGWNWECDDVPIRLGLTSTGNWSRLDVHDPDPVIPDPGTRGLLAESGKGLLIVNALAAACWWDKELDGKVVHAVIPMPQVELTAAELEAARR